MDKTLIEEWGELDDRFKHFIVRVFWNPNAKHAAEPYNDFLGSLWPIPEENGWIESTGSYKFQITSKFLTMVTENIGEKEVSEDFLKRIAPKKVTKEMAETVVNLLCGHMGDSYVGYVLYRLDRPSVLDDLWSVVAPPVNIRVKLFDPKTNEQLSTGVYDTDLTKSWVDERLAWRYDVEWIYDKYHEIQQIMSYVENDLDISVCIDGEYTQLETDIFKEISEALTKKIISLDIHPSQLEIRF